MEKFIFDLDGTLMNADFELESVKLRELFFNKEDAERVVSSKVKVLGEYEDLFVRYDIKTLGEYFTKRTGVYISEDFIREWLRFSSCLDDKIIDGVEDTLDYLKCKNKNLVILSNWFDQVQHERLRKNGLLDYFDNVYGGTNFLKPDRRAFMLACGDTPVSKCIMIGDNYLRDVCGARNAGLSALYFSPNNDLIEDKEKIKRIGEIKERF